MSLNCLLAFRQYSIYMMVTVNTPDPTVLSPPTNYGVPCGYEPAWATSCPSYALLLAQCEKSQGSGGRAPSLKQLIVLPDRS